MRFEVKSYRFLVYVLICLMYVVNSFQRYSTSVFAEPISESYGVPKAQLSTFSSVFFYSYSLMQTVTGMMGDIMDGGIVLGVGHLLSTVGVIVCALSNNLGVGCVGRFIVGIGCAPSWCMANRIVLNWFNYDVYPILAGIVAAAGGVGGIAASALLGLLVSKYNWRTCMWGLAIVEGLIAIAILVLIRATSKEVRWLSNYVARVEDPVKPTFCELLGKLWRNVKIIACFVPFWLRFAYAIFISGGCGNLTGMWITPYCRDVLELETQKAATLSMFLSVGSIVGPLALPGFLRLTQSVKIVCHGCMAIAFVVSLVWVLLPVRVLVFGFCAVMLALISGVMDSSHRLSIPLLVPLLNKTVGGTVTGLLATASNLGIAIYQNISAAIIEHYKVADANKYTNTGYKVSVWWLIVGSSVVGFLLNLATNDRDPAQHDDVVHDIEHEPEHGDEEEETRGVSGHEERLPEL